MTDKRNKITIGSLLIVLSIIVYSLGYFLVEIYTSGAGWVILIVGAYSFMVGDIIHRTFISPFKEQNIFDFIPVCAKCGRVRNKDGDWLTLESYLSQYSDARFSHGMCHMCIEDEYPVMAEKHKAHKGKPLLNTGERKCWDKNSKSKVVE